MEEGAVRYARRPLPGRCRGAAARGGRFRRNRGGDPWPLRGDRPAPLYKPQEYKKRLAVHGWIPEPRVPPYSPAHDDLPINERYDALKFFERDDEELGVAIEMEDWEIYNYLLKFRRGYERADRVPASSSSHTPQRCSTASSTCCISTSRSWGTFQSSSSARAGRG